MKRLLLTLAALLLVAPLLRAGEVALMKIVLQKKQAPQNVVLEFHEAEAPATVANFKKLARKKFYDGVTFHRVFPHILVQTGDPLSKKKDRTNVGTGGPGWTLPPEIRRKHVKGAVAMARLPDKINPSRVSNGSQFFICLKPNPGYDGQYTVFARVLQGFEVLDTISTRTADSNDNPVERVEIESIRIIPREEIPAPVAPAAPGAAPAKKSWWKFWG
jgi:cyclophilin family peptidyl-prolyl cis-trans isomerase